MITDEYGVGVEVDSTAPSRKAILYLEKRYKWVVLPRKFLLTGELKYDIMPNRLRKPKVPPSIEGLENVWDFVDERLKMCIKEVEEWM